MIEKVIIKNYKGIKEANISFHDRTNILVGNNGVGKSTVIEAISLVLGYGLNKFEITPSLFYKDTWIEFKNTKSPPEIQIDVFFTSSDALAIYSGTNNSQHQFATGISFKIKLDSAYAEDFNEEKDKCELIPCEYYEKSRTWFSDAQVKQLHVPYIFQVIDSTSSYFNSRTNQYVAKIMQEQMIKSDQVKMKGTLRKLRESFTNDSDIKEINKKLTALANKVANELAISVDMSTKDAWESIVCPVLEGIPISQVGLGEQCILKTLLSLNESGSLGKEKIVVIEEPESHLSHTKMYELLGLLAERTSGQLFVTTHNSFVANKLDLSNLIILSNNDGIIKHQILSNDENNDDYNFFIKRCDYPTLRLVLCKKAILVEGPTDEFVVEYYFQNYLHKNPYTEGIELIGINGTMFKHFASLANKIGKQIAVITDNDGMDKSNVLSKRGFSESDLVKVFTPLDKSERTLEPAFVNSNLDHLQELSNLVRKKYVGKENKSSLIDYMLDNKTEWGFKLLNSKSDKTFNVPQYIIDAIKWIIPTEISAM